MRQLDLRRPAATPWRRRTSASRSARVKIGLFMFTAFCATLFATLQVCDVGSAAADRGVQKEFEAIIAAVIGGTPAHRRLRLGRRRLLRRADLRRGADRHHLHQRELGLVPRVPRVMLLIAVIFNNYVRKRVTESR